MEMEIDYSAEPLSYKIFKQAEIEFEKMNLFERCCRFSSRFLELRAPAFLKKKWDDAIAMSGLKITSDEIYSFLILSFFVSFLILLPFSFFLEFPTNIILLFGLPTFVAYNIASYPQLYSDIIRIKAGNEVVDVILYMTIYLSLNPVYEKAVEFVALNCEGPLGKDFRKVVWDVDIGKYGTIREALGAYSKKWSIWNDEFVTSLITLQMIDKEGSPEKRKEIMNEAMERTLRSAYNKMKEYALNLKIPSTLILSFGIVLPLMGLIMFPLISIFLTNTINPIYIAVGYIIVLPFFLMWYLNRLILRRPCAFSHSGKSGGVKPAEYFEIKKLGLKVPIKLMALLLSILIILPGIFYFITLYFDYSYFYTHYPPHEAKERWREYCLSRYGPGIILGDVFQAMFVVWGISGGIIFYTYFRSRHRYELEEYIRKTEEDIEGGLFELGSVMAQNVPVEVAIPEVLRKYERMNKQRSPVYQFFYKINVLISKFSMTFEQALFHKEKGVLKDYPSKLLRDTMNIVASSISKSPIIVSETIKTTISGLRRIREIEGLIKDLLEEIISSLKMQITFITPIIGGLIASVSILIIQLLQSISLAMMRIEKMFNLGTNIGSTAYSTFSLIKLEEVMPPTIIETIIGIYLIEAIIIMTFFLVGIERGFDEVSMDYFIARNLFKGVLFFSAIFFLMVIIFQPIIGRIAGVV